MLYHNVSNDSRPPRPHDGGGDWWAAGALGEASEATPRPWNSFRPSSLESSKDQPPMVG